MRRGIWFGAAVLVAVAAAIPLWLALDDGGERRAAALQEPTAPGDVAKLTLQGANTGTLTLPVQSFTWGLKSPRDEASGQAAGEVVPQPLRIFKQVDASSPILFQMLTNNENISSATLELQGPDATGKQVTYMKYSLTNAHISLWQDGKREELELVYTDVSSEAMTIPRGPAGSNIGVMSVPSIGREGLPIQDFVASVKAPFDVASGLPTGKRQHKPFMVVRPIHATWAAFASSLKTNENLGKVTIELQRPGKGGIETYATYVYEGTHVVSVEDSAAAGVAPTQKLELTFQSVEVMAGTNNASDDWETPVQ